MDRRRSERRHTDGQVFRSIGPGRTVLHPLAAPDDDCLSSADLQHTFTRGHTEQAAQHDRVLVELRRLAGLDPALRAVHVGDAEASSPELTRPMYSSICLGLLPAAVIRVG